MKNIKYVYPLYERRGVDVNNVEQDIYGAVKSIPKASLAGIGILGVWGYSKIKRMLAFRKAKKEIVNSGEEFLEEIERWHALNDKKLAKVCASAVNNLNVQIQNLEKQYKAVEQENANNPNFSGISDREKKQQVDKVLDVISKKLKRQVDDYFKGLNSWSTGLLKNYTDEIFANLVDEKLSSEISKSLRGTKRTNEGVSDVVRKFNFTKLSKKQVKQIEGLWLKEIMEVNAKAGDMTTSNMDKIKRKYFKGDEYAPFASIFEMDIPKGFMTTEKVNDIKSYINELSSFLKYVDKDLLKQVDAKEHADASPNDDDQDGTKPYTAPSTQPSAPSTNTQSVAESSVNAFKTKLYESKHRINKNK